MPIYAYRCTTCGYAKDVLQKISDPMLSVCPNCGAATFQKQVTAAGFQLKGSGWYATDFRGDNKAGKPPAEGTPAPAKEGGGAGGGDAAASPPAASSPAPAADKAPAPASNGPAGAPAGPSGSGGH